MPNKNKIKIRVPIPKPVNRTPIPPNKVEPDRKKKLPREEKHKKGGIDE